jgi:hypothetical protein
LGGEAAVTRSTNSEAENSIILSSNPIRIITKSGKLRLQRGVLCSYNEESDNKISINEMRENSMC